MCSVCKNLTSKVRIWIVKFEYISLDGELVLLKKLALIQFIFTAELCQSKESQALYSFSESYITTTTV